MRENIIINRNKNKISLKFLLINFIYLYPLLALDRIKKISFFYVDGYRTTNEIWIILAASLILIMINFLNNKREYRKSNVLFWVLYYIMLIIIVAGAYNMDSTSQYIYAALVFTVPVLIFLLSSDWDYILIEKIIKLVILSTLFYSIFAIVLTTNYAFFMSLVGNPIDNYRYYSQYRASMMIGSSITASYYFNLTLPLCIYAYTKWTNLRWKKISFITIISNLMATILLLSRFATLSGVIIIFSYLLFISKKKRNLKKNILLILSFIVSTFFIANNYDITRLLTGMSFESMSAVQRFNAANLGLNIFQEFPLIGSGMGVFFKRIYDTRYISYSGTVGLIDPHNMYILIMSEMGLVGLVVFLAFIFLLFIRFSRIKDQVLSRISFITLIIIMVNSIGGSHLVNEISFSIIFWIIMSIFNNAAIQSKSNTQNEVLE